MTIITGSGQSARTSGRRNPGDIRRDRRAALPEQHWCQPPGHPPALVKAASGLSGCRKIARNWHIAAAATSGWSGRCHVRHAGLSACVCPLPDPLARRHAKPVDRRHCGDHRTFGAPAYGMV